MSAEAAKPEEQRKPAEVIAQWSASLDCDCPSCHEYVDLLEYPDFWDGRPGLEIAEHGTEQSNNLDVTCPKCGHNFEVCCQW